MGAQKALLMNSYQDPVKWTRKLPSNDKPRQRALGGRRHPVVCGFGSVAPTGVLQESQKRFCLVDEDELCLPLAQTLQLKGLGTVWTGKPLSYKAHQRQELERSLLPQRKQGAMVNPTVCYTEHPTNVRLP